VQVAVSLYSIEQSRVVLVTDISTTGCRIRGVALPEVGCEVLLKSTDADFFGTVKWADDAERGIAFDQPIDPEMLQKLKQEESWQLHQSLKGER
jgi:hypothetical protein